MRRTAALPLLVAATLLLAGCGGVGGSTTGGTLGKAPADNEKVTVNLWSPFSGREEGVIQSVIDDFSKKHPNYTIKVVEATDDEKINQAIRGGKSPDVAISFSTDAVGQFCNSGAMQKLKPYLERDSIDVTKEIPDAVRGYTEFKGNRCVMPLLFDLSGFYYNKDILAENGYSAPPKTWSELVEMAKKMTTFNADGSIKRAGWVPLWGNNYSPDLGAGVWGAEWRDADGKSAVSKGSAWSDMIKAQKEIVDWYGYDKLQTFIAGAGQSFSADNDFYRGRVAMTVDGEYRTAFIAADAPDLNYGTAPFPAADDKPELYGGGLAGGSIIGIPKGAKQPGAAWEIVKYLSLDTGALVKLANGLANVPSTNASIKSKDLKLEPQFDTFLDMASSGKLYSSPASSNGGAYRKPMNDFLTLYEKGQGGDLEAGLEKVDEQTNTDSTLGGN